MNARLWDEESDDHFITQLNPDGSTVDKVDYDSQLLAVAFGVLDDYPGRRDRVLERVDNGEYTHVRATYASEYPYLGGSVSEDECYIVDPKDEFCGDSVVTLARIGWVDALARKRRKSTHDVHVFNDLLLIPIQDDLVQSTWLRERYNREGENIANQYYFEVFDLPNMAFSSTFILILIIYLHLQHLIKPPTLQYPSLISIMLREVKYGIDIKIGLLSPLSSFLPLLSASPPILSPSLPH
jgi:hypothetical protein